MFLTAPKLALNYIIDSAHIFIFIVIAMHLKLLLINHSTEMGIEKFLGIVYELEKVENDANFCTYMGYSNVRANEFSRHSWETLKLDGSYIYKDLYKFVRRTSSSISVFEFTPNQKFWEISADNGVWRQCEVELLNNSLVFKEMGEKDVQVVRTFEDTKMLMTVTCERVYAKKYFRAVGKDFAYNNEEFGNHCLPVCRNLSNFL